MDAHLILPATLIYIAMGIAVLIAVIDIFERRRGPPDDWWRVS